VLVSGDSLTGDVAATLADGATTTTIANSAVQASDVDATNGAVTGQCLTKSASGDQFTWASCLRSTDITIQSLSTALAWTNMPSAVTEIYNNSSRRVAFDLTGFGQFRLEAVQSAAGALDTQPKLRAQYSSDQSSWSNLEDSTTNGDLTVSASSGTQVVVGSWVNIVAAARADVYVRLVGLNGDAIGDPSWYTLRIQMK
jgi:hypothetical protein